MKPLKPEEFAIVPGGGAPYVGDELYGIDPAPPLPEQVEPDTEVSLPK
jgi:hypothetical protein